MQKPAFHRCCSALLPLILGLLAAISANFFAPVQAGRQLLATCSATPTDALGPYYLAGVPKRAFRFRFCQPVAGFNYTNLTVSGRVTSTKSGCKKNVVGATIEIWQADNAGQYDVTPANITTARCRTKIMTDKAGKYSYATIMPARYGGSCPRPSHVHLRVSAPGFQTLVTQMYFRGMNEGTCSCLGCNNPLLQTNVTKASRAVFDIVLTPN